MKYCDELISGTFSSNQESSLNNFLWQRSWELKWALMTKVIADSLFESINTKLCLKFKLSNKTGPAASQMEILIGNFVSSNSLKN